MNTLTWILQGLLAFMMLMVGFMKFTMSKVDIKKKGNGHMDWVDNVSAGNVKLIGIVEILIGFGLILPQLLGILPWLTPLAAIGVILTMIGASMLHMSRKDGSQAVMTNIVILIIATFVAYGRFALFTV